MSTPISQNSNLEGLDIYAPRRTRTQAASGNDVSPSQTPLHVPASDQPHALDDDELSADADSVQAAQARLDEAISAAIDVGRPFLEPQSRDSAPLLPPAANLRLPQGGAVGRPASSSDLPASLRRSRLDPEIVPEPPSGTQGRIAPLLVRFALVGGFAAITAYGLTIIPPFGRNADLAKHTSDSVPAIAPISPEAPSEPQPRLAVENQQAFANEPLSLGVSVDPAKGHESLLLAGLALGTRLSAGAPVSEASWQLSARDLGGVYVYAPKDFVGVMNAAIDLLSPSKKLMDSRAVRLEWVAKKSAPPQPGAQVDAENSSTTAIQPMDHEEAAMLMKRGQDFLSTGDITAARIAFLRLADAGIADGAFAAATTYDPRYFAEHNIVGVRGDETKARALYQRAMKLGSTEAGDILAQMVAK